jgi:hypothetical protein
MRVLICFTIILDSSELHDNYQQKHLVAKQEELSEKQALNFTNEVSVSYSQSSLKCRKVLRSGTNGFTSPPKEVELLIFIIIKKSVVLSWV